MIVILLLLLANSLFLWALKPSWKLLNPRFQRKHFQWKFKHCRHKLPATAFSIKSVSQHQILITFFCYVWKHRVALSYIFAFLLYALPCSLSRSSRRVLPILAHFLTFLRDFLDSLYAVYPLVSLIGLSLSIQPTCIFTQNPLSTNLNLNNFLRLTKL